MTTPKKKGYLIIQALVFGSIGLIIIGGLVGFANVNIRAARLFVSREKAFQIAEAGIAYYRWHLTQAPGDFKDGTNVAGPYTHQYTDKDGNVVGSFILTITAPPSGSTDVTIVSEGRVVENASISRKIEVKLAYNSFTKYALVANSVMRFGEGTNIYGPIHSNDGIRIDGVAHNLVTSARADYDDPDHTGANEFGVHTHLNSPIQGGGTNSSARPLESPPPPVPNRSDVFLAGRQFPVPALDFTGISIDLAKIKTSAEQNGLSFAHSGALGYNVILKVDDTFDLYRVNSLYPPPSGCDNYLSQSGWGTWSINTAAGSQTFLNNYPFPSNGLIFFADNVWVEGKINTARLTIASGRFPENANTDTNITFDKDIRYTNYNGTDVIALVAQNNVSAGLLSNNVLTVDAALLAKNGRVGRYYYRPRHGNSDRCEPYHVRNTFNLYGTIITNGRYGFAYSDYSNSSQSEDSGYTYRNITYDPNLLYSPPPSFPRTSERYSVTSWREL